MPSLTPVAETKGRPRELVVCSLEAWDGVWRRNQFLVDELLGRDPGLRVLFVEPPVDVLHRPSRARGFRRLGLHPVADYDRLWRLAPVKVLPRVVGPLADRSLARQLLGAVRRLGFRAPTLWVNDSSYAPLVRRVRWPTLYDVTDDWLLATATPRELARLRTNEELLLEQAGAVVVCSPALARSRGQQREAVLIPNGVDLEHFRRPAARPADLPGSPTAVYVGTQHEDRLDVKLCVELSERLPHLNLVLIGPSSLGERSAAALGARPNIHLLGPRPYRDVPAYLQHAEVIVVPHRITPFTESLDPIKAYECLAVDTPTVATAVAGFRELAGEVVVVRRDDFVRAVGGVLEQPPDGGPRRLPPSWTARAEEFASVVDGLRRRPLRVAYVDHCARLSGGELALLRLLPALSGVEAQVVLAEDGPLRPELQRGGASVDVLPMGESVRRLPRERVRPGLEMVVRAAGAARYVVRLAAYLRKAGPDLVHTNSLKASLYGGLAGRLAGIPVIWHVRDRVAPDYLPRAAVVLVRLALRVLPTGVIANSRSTLRTLGAAGGHSTVIYDPLGTVSTERRDRIHPLRIGIVGRISPWKGQDLFLRAFARAFPDGEEVAAVIGAPLFGEDNFKAELHHLSRDLGLEERVEFRGFREDIAGELGRLDILVHASVIPEPFGLVVIEGMAAGLVVIAADAGGPAEIICDRVDGILYPMGDVDGLATALAAAAADPVLRARLASTAAGSARRFEPSVIAQQVLAFYDTVLEGKVPLRSRPC